MEPQQVERARQAKRMYLLALLFNVVVGGCLRFSPDNMALSILGLGWLIFSVVVTWRFCRSIQIGKAASAVNAVLSPFIFISTHCAASNVCEEDWRSSDVPYGRRLPRVPAIVIRAQATAGRQPKWW
jgi:hypothetical protein